MNWSCRPAISDPKRDLPRGHIVGMVAPLMCNTRLTAWPKGYGDALVRILPERGRDLPFEKPVLFFFCGSARRWESIYLRAVLRRVLDRARTMGFAPYAANEIL